MTEDRRETEEISLLDILVVAAESWVLIVLGGVLVAALTFALESRQPKIYTSSATVAVSVAEAQAIPAATSETEGTFHFVPVSNFLGVSASDDRPMTRVTYSNTSADDVETVFGDYLSAAAVWLVEHKNANLRADWDAIEGRMSTVDQAIQTASASIQELRTSGLDAAGLAPLLSLQQQLERERFQLEREARSINATLKDAEEAAVIATPAKVRLVDDDDSLIHAILAGMSVAFFLLLASLFRQGLREAIKIPQQQEKLQRIKDALLLRRKRTSRLDNKDADAKAEHGNESQ